MKPDPELLDDDNPELTDADFARMVPFTALPEELQRLLSSPKRIVPDRHPGSSEEPAA